MIELPPIEVREGDGLPATLPPDLVWKTNEGDPVFASSEARRGGTFRTWMLSFPLTLRRVGPDSNGAFAGYLRYNQLGPVSYHPNTRRPIPSLATHWAFGADGRSIYYRLNPRARWSDGVPVTADDYVFAVRFLRSKVIVAPWYNNYYTERIRDVKRYDDHTIGVQGADAKPVSEMHAAYGTGPYPRHFHTISSDWVKNTNWEIEPNTGPYRITEVRKGQVHRAIPQGRLVGRRDQVQPAPLQSRQGARAGHPGCEYRNTALPERRAGRHGPGAAAVLAREGDGPASR